MYLKHKNSINRLVLFESVAYPVLFMYFFHLNLCTGQKIVSSLEEYEYFLTQYNIILNGLSLKVIFI